MGVANWGGIREWRQLWAADRDNVRLCLERATRRRALATSDLAAQASQVPELAGT